MIIAILCVAIYCVMAIFVGRSIYNITLLRVYEDNLKRLQSNSMKDWYIGYYKKDTIEEVALHQVFRHTMTRENAVMLGTFWLFSGLWYLLHLKGAKIRIVPKNVVEKQIEAKKKQLETQEKLSEAIKLLKAAGIKEEDITIGQSDRIK